MESLLKSKKLSVTPFRVEVLSVLQKNESAVTLQTFESKLTSYNRITLYRTLKSFIEKGIIHEIKIGGEENRYAICKDKCGTNDHRHQHIHFKCEKCAEVTCADTSSFPNIDLPNFTIHAVEIQATGLCNKCN